jgi:hypothetical protein
VTRYQEQKHIFESVSLPVSIGVGKTPPRGRLIGILRRGEDHAAIERALVNADTVVTRGAASLMTHLDLDPSATQSARREQLEQSLSAVAHRRLERYVFAIDTGAGRRIVKISEPRKLGNRLLGWAGRSVARQEHQNHCRAEALDLAASETCGFLEWRAELGLIRACQLQTPIDPDLRTVGQRLTDDLESLGDQALDRYADALAAAHAVPFFHADLKAFHAFADPRPRGYRLRFLDLARVSFRMTRRKRIINLYQSLRWILPKRPEAEQRFVAAYCEASGWYARDPARALAIVRQFLAYKYRTHQP